MPGLAWPHTCMLTLLAATFFPLRLLALQDLRSRVNAEYREVVERRVYTGARAGACSPALWTC